MVIKRRDRLLLLLDKERQEPRLYHLMLGMGEVGARALSVAADVSPSFREATMLPGFISEQWQALVTAFDNPHPPNNRLNCELTSNMWIIDIWSSRHVTGELSCLVNIC